ncbi:MAG: phosphatidylserine decarboxylase [Chloroflexota bacterium]
MIGTRSLRYLNALAADDPALGAIRAGAPLATGLAMVGLAAVARSRPMGVALLALASWAAWFFRDPPRVCPGEPDTVYAAADGVVTAVDEVEWDWFIYGRALRIVTFLSLVDVHVNRSPVAGRLVASRRDPGSFAPAFLVGGSANNARQLLGIEAEFEVRRSTIEARHDRLRTSNLEPRTAPGRHRVVVAQVAGFLARRIVSWRLPGDAVAAGQKLGMIRFGSRTDVLVPAGVAEPLVSPGTRVRAGLTPIARYRAEATVRF